ncbi:xaa-Pro aminopeptidase 3-like [Uloborus diversus]|uniref:xaa-Pro aminopeptidase 3-like n=1 Tax=Uloborus diversus TaxID=327109 RepID=UPI0024090127|nr:xaa-Pro aminopeptidase 3-like [Uloborus diversus]
MNAMAGYASRAFWKRKWFSSSNMKWTFLRYFFNANYFLNAQPTSKTHKHLLKSNEINPGLSVDSFHERRKKLIESVRNDDSTFVKNEDSHLIVIPSNSIAYMSDNIPFPFRQNSDFLYLSGYKEANCVLLLCTSANESYDKSILFIPKPTAHSERWEGTKMDLSTVSDFLGLDEAFYLGDLEVYLQSFAQTNRNFTLWYDYLNSPFQQLHQIMRDFMAAYKGKISVESPRSVLHEIRLIKSKREIDLLRKSCDIAAEAMTEVMKFSKPSISEAHLFAKMEFECRMGGADRLSFPPVVAGGDRANTIHYIDNNQLVNDGDMVLVDAGCEYHGYCSDLARTWPVNGRFTSAQKELYEVILSVQKELIHMCEQKPSLDHLFRSMCQSLGKQFQNLGIISKSASIEDVMQIAYNYCPHHVSHYLGMDVHDTSLMSRSIKLQPGMVVTVEPGVYISKTDSRVPERFKGFCIRIEDDILITDEGYEILTANCPKDVSDIEKVVGCKSKG